MLNSRSSQAIALVRPVIDVDPVQTVLDRLPGHRRTGDGQYEARCPSHEDGRASLSIGVGADARVLLKCHAGCETSEVLRAMELAPADLFPAKPVERRIVAQYPYTDEAGAPLFEVVRYEPKDFRQRHRGENGEWVWKMNGVRRVPYRLPELTAASAAGAEVWVVEGEKDVDTLRAKGLVATCNPGGAGKWRPEYNNAFKGAGAVYVIPDNDDPGRAHAQAVAMALRGEVPVVKVVPLPAGKDVAEWFGLGGNTQRLGELAAGAPHYATPSVPAVPAASRNGLSDPFPSPSKGTGGTGNGKGVIVPESGTGTTTTLFESVGAFLERAAKAPPLVWLMEKLVPGAGKIMLVAAPNAGKTWLALLILKAAAALGRVCFFVEEEGGLRALADRMRALQLENFSGINVAHLRGVSLDDRAMVQRLCATLAAEEAPVLVFDPLNSVWAGDENETHSATLLRQTLDLLARANPRALVIVLHHTSKAGEKGEGPALYASRGSTVFSGWADAQLNLTHVETPKGAGQVAFDVLAAKMRDDERGHRVRITIGLGTGEVTMEARSTDRTGDLEPRVTAALKSAAEPLSKTALRGVVRVRNEDLGPCVDSMLSRNLLRVDPKGRFSLAARPGQRDSRERALPEGETDA